MKQLLIYGHSPTLSSAEATAVLGEPLYQSAFGGVFDTTIDPVVLLNRLGGSTRIATPDIMLPKFTLKMLLADSTREILRDLIIRSGARDIGISVFSRQPISPKAVFQLGLSLKKALRDSGTKLRLIPNKASALSSAQVLKNALTGSNGAEIILVEIADQTILARTYAVQDIDSYTLRDMGKPRRDMKVGMLPPKLAQVAINLGLGKLDPASATIYDPFCGTGTVLTEALLMGAKVLGSDSNQRMVDHTKVNLKWLVEKFSVKLPTALDQMVWQADVTKPTRLGAGTIDAIVTEGYLGPLLEHEPSASKREEIFSDISSTIKHFVKNQHALLKDGGRLVLMLPLIGGQLPSIVDELPRFGYTTSRYGDLPYLIYEREGQIVKRAIISLTKK